MPNRKILFIFDRVTHYHKDLFKTLDELLLENGDSLYLLSGEKVADDSGRIPLSEKVIGNEDKYVFKEWRVKTFTFRRHYGIFSHIKKIKPDVVVVQSHVGNITYWQMILLKKTLGFKLVSWQCGYEYNPSFFKNLLLHAFVSRFDYHLAYHTNAMKYCLQHGARPDEVSVMHNTINDNSIALMEKDQAREIVYELIPQLKGKKVVLYVGAVLKEKCIELAAEALTLLDDESVVLLVIGDGPHLKALKEKYIQRKDVIFTGRIVDGVGKYFDAADVFVLPGTGGLAINEAMVHGLPVLSAYADGSADDLVVDGQNGYRLRDDSAIELSARLRQLLQDPLLTQRMGLASQAMVKERFSFNAFVQRVFSGITEI